MELQEIVQYLNEYFAPYFPQKDVSQNGLQVDANVPVTKIATAVDACMSTFEKVQKENAQLLLVHHGLFWGKSLLINGIHGNRIRFLMQHGISLYGMHLPLDMHAEIGNNVMIAKKLGWEIVKPFGCYHDMSIGVEAHLAEQKPLQEVVQQVEKLTGSSCRVLDFGKQSVQKIGIVSGGGASELDLAASSKLDVLLTGEGGHVNYHQALEQNMNVIYAGHYATETFGIYALGEHLHEKFGLPHIFIDNATNY